MPVILDPDSYDLWLDPGDEGRGCLVRHAEALRRPADAALSRECPDQFCGQRRPSLLRTRGTTADPESSLLVSAATFRKEHCGLTFSNVESDLNHAGMCDRRP